MNTKVLAALGAVVLALASGPALAQTIKDAGFALPESMRYDAANDRYLVANINVDPVAVDNNGFISIVTPDGKVANLKWIAGGVNGVTLDAPKGIAIFQGTIHVADLSRIRMFDLLTGAPKGERVIEGARILNDLVIAADGTIYVTDSGDFAGDVTKGAIFKITAAGQVSALARGAELKVPNGIALDAAGNVVMVPFGGAEVQTRRSSDGALIDTKPLQQGQLDGLIILPDGSKLISSWQAKQVVRQMPDGSVRVVVDNVEGPAAIGFDSKRQKVLVPQLTQNALVIADLK
jgi:sugar lactone lactonase YvrE